MFLPLHAWRSSFATTDVKPKKEEAGDYL